MAGGGSGRRGLYRELIFVLLFGVAFPLTQGEAWRAGVLPVAFVFMIPLFLAGPYVADTFAGERERRTLETLLSTRLPDSAIYLGKVLAVCTYAWTVTQLILLASLLALNLSGGDDAGGRFVYPTAVWVASLAGSFASALLIAGIGTFVSMRSDTVRAAHQATMIPLFVLIFGGSFGIGALWRALPEETRVYVLRWAAGISPLEAIVGFVSLLFLVGVMLLRTGVHRFRRARLIGR